MLSFAQIMVTVFALWLGAYPVLAEQAEPGFPPKFTLNDVTLVYDTESVGADEPAGITSDDVENLLRILRSDESIRRLQINSSGGSVYAAQQISDIIIDFGLDTHVHGDCDSSCVTIFLAGTKRTMSRGSRIGFHQIFWSAENIASYYDRERGEQGWATPYDFAAWMYLDTQDEMYAHLKYITSRGVDPGFAIETIRNPQSEMWRPYRAELLKAGVLTE
ncbi:ATP-dependent Clp protease proteolytic subunit [Phaeobacter sp. 22II1-1F12B]|uniref:ATP-dependent Clp protease proteolytic subunit n=1 Tax=Phaeobacter sp. 22II1-1F12B TaxID=1317111 RepID=UPI000B6FE802|nr:ATP-dependent Clp protease proteolytic subunit [Phaeobacter sp. 22II1-1F12B]OWU81935.1 hypothetical protein ATO1_03220 [Phaeobacter sp. 22II1-1F12B]